MRKSPFLTSLLLAGIFVLGSCTKETVEKAGEVVVQENDVPNGVKRITYSVSVVPANVCTGSRVTGLAGAQVRCVQGSAVVTRTTNESGIAVFTNLGPGAITVSVNAPQYIGMNFVAVLTSTTGDTDVDQIEFGASMIALFKKNAQVKGAIRANWAEVPNLPINSYPFQIPVSMPPPYPTLYVEYTLTQALYITAVQGVTFNPSIPNPSGTIRSVSMDEIGASTQLQGNGHFTVPDVISIPANFGISATLKMVDYLKQSQAAGVQWRKYSLPPQPPLQLGPCSPSPFGVGDITITQVTPPII